MIALYKHAQDIAVSKKLIIVLDSNPKLSTIKMEKKNHSNFFLWILPGKNNPSMLRHEICMYAVNMIGKSS